MPKINQDQLNSILVPLAPFSEQQVIVERVGRLMSITDEMGKQVTERKDLSEELMQSVLREAFAGSSN